MPAVSGSGPSAARLPSSPTVAQRPPAWRVRSRRAASVVLGVALAIVIVLTGCGGDGDTTTTTAAPASTSVTTPTTDGSTTTATPPVIKSGVDLFSVFCAGCHGSDGKATFTPTVVGVDADLVKAMITDGSDDMEGYGDRLSPEEIQAIADYVVTLK